MDFLDKRYPRELDLWIKIDAGGKRTGIPSENPAAIIHLAEKIAKSVTSEIQGNSFPFWANLPRRSSQEEAARLYTEGIARMSTVQICPAQSWFSEDTDLRWGYPWMLR